MLLVVLNAISALQLKVNLVLAEVLRWSRQCSSGSYNVVQGCVAIVYLSCTMLWHGLGSDTSHNQTLQSTQGFCGSKQLLSESDKSWEQNRCIEWWPSEKDSTSADERWSDESPGLTFCSLPVTNRLLRQITGVFIVCFGRGREIMLYKNALSSPTADQTILIPPYYTECLNRGKLQGDCVLMSISNALCLLCCYLNESTKRNDRGCFVSAHRGTVPWGSLNVSGCRLTRPGDAWHRCPMNGHDRCRCGGGQETFIKNGQEISNSEIHAKWSFNRGVVKEKLKSLMLHCHAWPQLYGN